MWEDSSKESIEKEMYMILRSVDVDKYVETIRTVGDNCERMDLVYKLLQSSAKFQKLVSEPKPQKSNEESVRLRMKGNDLYKEKKFLDAVQSYTESICYAENESKFLALAYSNRSAVLFGRKYYNECIMDIERAFQCQCPEEIKEKLERRKKTALRLNKSQRPINYYTPVPPIINKNPLISSASDSVELQNNEKFGNHVIATKDIQVGEIVLIEKPFACMIHHKSSLFHCHECLMPCYNMIPCDKCTTALYCSENCLKEAYNSFHKYECDFIPFLLKYRQLFIRVLIEALKELRDLSDDTLDETYRSDRFKEINTLVSHENEGEILNIIIGLSVACVCYHNLLNIPKFVDDFDISDDRKFKNLLYRIFRIHYFNPFSIKKIKYSLENIRSEIVGTGIYAFGSKFNHSCVPNCDFVHHGTDFVVRAIANIKKGDQCTLCYRFSYSTTEFSYRRTLLKRSYLFDCECVACVERWPIYKKLPVGCQIPMWFQMKCMKHSFENTNPNGKVLKELLSEGIQLYNILERDGPSQNLLTVQNQISEMYAHMGCKPVNF